MSIVSLARCTWGLLAVARTSINSYSNHSQIFAISGPAVFRRSESTVRVIFKDHEGGQQECHARIGQNILDVAIDNDIDLEGACGGTLACSTCHVIVDQHWFNKLNEAEDEELDMLDLASGLTDTSRLGCQIQLTKDLDGIEVTLPDEQQDMRNI
eukprot:gene514-3839_t